MKKPVAFLMALAALSLAGCSDNSQSVSSNQSEPESSQSEVHSSAESAESAAVELDSETLALIESFPLDSFVGYDGNTVGKTEAIAAEKINDDVVYLTFDFAYMRYATPIWENTAENPNLVNWDTLEFNTDTSVVLENPEYFKVKAGDVLENGLTVENAESVFYTMNECDEDGNLVKTAMQLKNEIELSGELTLDGILHCVSGDSDYIDADGDLLFFADTSKCSNIPVPSTANSDIDMITRSVDIAGQFALICDGYRFYLGNINTTTTDLSGIIKQGEYISATVTLDNIRIVFSDGAGKIVNADIVSVN